MEEQTLIKDCLNGNPIAQRKLFEKFAPKMMTVCLRYMKDRQEAEDVLQDGFVKVFQKFHLYENSGSLEGWIRRIIVNTALDQLRKNSKFGYMDDVDEVGYKIENNSYTFENLVAQDLMKMIDQMPNGYKVVFNMFAIEGYSHKEIGEMLGISENTSKSQYLRARDYLKKQLEKIEIEREG
ncbi:MAG TPA: RNA polymerase sigma factor [Taishania sp.]|nr:RNA polymerase sigma factor [Taishania sp.]HNS41481.1 RNA polymerase sigma factor [Taishania sp.]